MSIWTTLSEYMGFLGDSVVKNTPAVLQADARSILRSGRPPGGGHGNPLQCSCLENPTDRGAWWAAVFWVTESWTGLKRLSVHACISEYIKQ